MGSQVPANDFLSGITDLTNEIGTRYILQQITDAGVLADATNPTKGYTQTPDNTSITAICVNYKEEDIDGTLVRSGDRMFAISLEDLDVTPEEGDLILNTAGTETWVIIKVEMLEISGTDVAAFCQARK